MAVKYNIPEILKTGKTIECFVLDKYYPEKRHYFKLTPSELCMDSDLIHFFNAKIMFPSRSDSTDSVLLHFKRERAVRIITVLSRYIEVAIPLSEIKIVAIY